MQRDAAACNLFQASSCEMQSSAGVACLTESIVKSATLICTFFERQAAAKQAKVNHEKQLQRAAVECIAEAA